MQTSEETPTPDTAENIDKWRQITPLVIKDYNIALPFDGELLMVDPTTLIVDASYQRNPSRKSIRLIYKIVAEWSWSAFKPPICIKVGEFLHVLDGQHTSIAAASHPLIERIPVFVVNGELDRQARAAAFVRQNTDRTAVTAIVKFRAELEAGDETAIGVHMALRAAKVVLTEQANLRQNALTTARAGTSAVASLKKMYKKYGLQKLIETLKVCVDSEIGQIPQFQLLAVADLMHARVYAGKYKGDMLAAVVREYPPAEFQGDIIRHARDCGIANQKAATIVLSKRYRAMEEKA